MAAKGPGQPGIRRRSDSRLQSSRLHARPGQAQGWYVDGPARRPHPRSARGRHPRRRPAPGPGRRGFGQDPGHHPAGRLHARQGDRRREHPGPDLHQQGGRRDEGADRGPRPALGRLGRHLPRPLRPAAPVLRPARRDRPGVHHLRPVGPAPGRQGRDGAAGAGRRRRHPRAGRLGDQPGQERPRLSRSHEQAGRRPRPGRHRQGLRPLPGTAESVLGRRLRRPPGPPRHDPQEAPRRPRPARRPVPLRPRRRISGYEPRPVRDRPGPLRRPPQPLRHRRPRPVDLRLAGGQPEQHPRVRTRLQGLQGRQARTKLPKHQEHPPRCRQFDPPQFQAARRRRSRPRIPKDSPSN